MRYAVIQNKDSGKIAGVLVHDHKAGRVVIKVRDADWPLQRAFDLWIDEPIIFQAPKQVGEYILTVRQKAVKSSPDYLGRLLDKMCRRPYEVVKVLDSKSTVRLDNLADTLAKEEIT